MFCNQRIQTAVVSGDYLQFYPVKSRQCTRFSTFIFYRLYLSTTCLLVVWVVFCLLCDRSWCGVDSCIFSNLQMSDVVQGKNKTDKSFRKTWLESSPQISLAGKESSCHLYDPQKKSLLYKWREKSVAKFFESSFLLPSGVRRRWERRNKKHSLYLLLFLRVLFPSPRRLFVFLLSIIPWSLRQGQWLPKNIWEQEKNIALRHKTIFWRKNIRIRTPRRVLMEKNCIEFQFNDWDDLKFSFSSTTHHRWDQEKEFMRVHKKSIQSQCHFSMFESGKYSNPSAHDNDRRYAVCQFVTQTETAFAFDQN